MWGGVLPEPGRNRLGWEAHFARRLGEKANLPPHPGTDCFQTSHRRGTQPGVWALGPERTHAVSSPQARWRRRRCSVQGEKLQRSGRGPSCRKSCSMSVGAATYTVRTVPKLANHTGPKRATPCTWENGHGGHWRPGPGTSSLVRADVKDVGWALQEGSSVSSQAPS